MALSGLWCLQGRPAGAQQLLGVLVVDPPGRRVPDAVVQLLAGNDSVAASTSTSATGRFDLRAREGGLYRVRVLRIGHRPWVSEPLNLASGPAQDTTLVVPPQAVTLAEIVVTTRTSCRGSPSEDDRMALLWDQARTALALAEGDVDGDLEFRGSTTRRQFDEAGFLSDERRWSLFSRGSWPVASQPSDSLADFGFVQPRDTLLGPVYFGPDVAVFFSEAFLETHCFRLIPAPHRQSELAGLGFEPVSERELPDIEGVLWLDRTTGALVRLVFRYTGLWDWVPARSAGGEIQFDRLPAGRPVVSGWLLRVPIARRELGPQLTTRRRRQDEDDTERFFGRGRISLFGYEEEQSRVDRITRQGTDALWLRASGDTISATPVPFNRDPW